MCVCVCVCVCKKERERERRDRSKERIIEKGSDRQIKKETTKKGKRGERVCVTGRKSVFACACVC